MRHTHPAENKAAKAGAAAARRVWENGNRTMAGEVARAWARYDRNLRLEWTLAFVDEAGELMGSGRVGGITGRDLFELGQANEASKGADR